VLAGPVVVGLVTGGACVPPDGHGEDGEGDEEDRADDGAGLAVMGLGLSALFPLTLQATGRQAAPGPALAAVSTLGYAGFLTGPPTIGLLAEATSLRAALLPVCALCLLAALLTRHLAGPAREEAR
jgi:hypothetical protein